MKKQSYFNNDFISTSANKGANIDNTLSSAFMVEIQKAEEEKKMPMGVMCAINFEHQIYILFTEPKRVADRVRKGNKILCPVGKNQFIDLLNEKSPYIKHIGSESDFLLYASHIRQYNNNGKPMQKFIANRLHTKTDLNAKLSKGGDCIIYGGRCNEVKLFDFTKTSGTPSAHSDK